MSHDGVNWRLPPNFVIASKFMNEPNILAIGLHNPNEEHQLASNIFSQPTTLHFLEEIMCTNKHHGWYVWPHDAIQRFFKTYNFSHTRHDWALNVIVQSDGIGILEIGSGWK